MTKIDRNSLDDAQDVVEKLIPDSQARNAAISFLVNAMIYANGLKSNNWNLNLAKNGQSIQFNVGYEISIYIAKNYVRISVLRDCLKQVCDPNQLGIEFGGSVGKEHQISSKLETVPDCLVKVPGSVSCRLRDFEKISNILPILEKPNQDFIHYAIHHTKLAAPRMVKSHSPGLIAYLSKATGREVPNPTYYITEQEFYQQQERAERKSRQHNRLELQEKITQKAYTQPEQVTITASKFKRDPDVVAYAKLKAKGICQDCLRPAPFINKSTKEPFLETHHIIPLAAGGTDTIDNVIVLCPNCHRKRHYG